MHFGDVLDYYDKLKYGYISQTIQGRPQDYHTSWKDFI